MVGIKAVENREISTNQRGKSWIQSNMGGVKVGEVSEPIRLQFQEVDIEVVDNEGEKWIIANQLADAMGAERRAFQKIIQEMEERGELREGVHYRFIPLETKGGMQTCRVLSKRGAVRVSMRSDAPRAIEFRDWAEDVLFEVMTTGGYGGSNENVTLLQQALEAEVAQRARLEMDVYELQNQFVGLSEDVAKKMERVKKALVKRGMGGAL